MEVKVDANGKFLMTDMPQQPLRFVPVGLNVEAKECLVVGGGAVGTRKAQSLLRAGAAVTVVSPTVTEALARQVDAGRMRWIPGPFRDDHLRGAFLVVAATNDHAVNAVISKSAGELGVLVCDASSAQRSQIIFGARLDLDDTTIAVFSNGRDPARAARTRDQIAELLRVKGESDPRL